MADLQQLVNDLSKLTVLEAAELSKKLRASVGCFRCCCPSDSHRVARPLVAPPLLRPLKRKISQWYS
jgi:hypothetical protein